jgi:hypothetical protein
LSPPTPSPPTTIIHCKTTLTYCAIGDGQTDTESRLIQCSLFDTTFRTIYVHSEDHLHSHERPIFDSHAFPALRASDVILDGSIDVPFDLVEYAGETFATVGGHFLYMYIGDTDDTTWNAVQFNQWNAVLHDGTPSSNGCLDGVPPLAPPTPFSPPASPPVFYLETNATECPLGPLTLALCDAANIELHGTGDTHIDITEAPTSPRGCFVSPTATYAYSSLDNPNVDCFDVTCVCLHPNTTFASPIQPPAPPLAPPPPSPPFRPPPEVPPPHSPPSTPLPPIAPPPVNLTIGGISVDNATIPAWQFEVIIVENTKTRIYFESGFAYEAADFVIFVPMYAGCFRTHYTHMHTFFSLFCFRGPTGRSLPTTPAPNAASQARSAGRRSTTTRPTCPLPTTVVPFSSTTRADSTSTSSSTTAPRPPPIRSTTPMPHSRRAPTTAHASPSIRTTCDDDGP